MASVDPAGEVTVNVDARFESQLDAGPQPTPTADLDGSNCKTPASETTSVGQAQKAGETVVFGYEDPEQNLLKNWSFEEPITDDDWIVEQATATRSQDSHTGEWSLYIHSRKQKYGHPYQRVFGLKSSSHYYYSCFIKFLSHPEESMHFQARLFLYIKLQNKDQRKKAKVGRLSFLRAPTQWHQFGADFKTPDEPIEWIEPHLEVDHESVDYLIDSASLIELPDEKEWKEKAKEDIEKHRTSTVNLSLNLPCNVDPSEFVIKIQQVKRDFGFGGGISADVFNGDGQMSENYRRCFFDNFEWAVFINDTKWRPMEKKKGWIRFDRVDKALEKLHAKGITVRAHAIHWNRMESCPDWVQPLEGEELEREIERRVKYVVEHFRGRFVQWDVCNEHLHNHFFEVKTGKHDILHRICRMAHEIDPECHLYLNDYQLVRTGDLSSAQANLARDLLSEGVPIHGVGIQSHLKSVPLPVQVLKKRLQIVCSAGLPVMITEFSVHTNEVEQRAQSLMEALYVYFSNPQVAGVIFWHFGDQPGITMDDDDMALFEGPDFVPNKAGEMLMKLLKKWRTNKKIQPTEHQTKETFRAFHGKYELEVIRNGSRIWGQSFRVQKGKSLDLDVDIELAGSCPDDGLDQSSQQQQCEIEPSLPVDTQQGICVQQEVSPQSPASTE